MRFIPGFAAAVLLLEAVKIAKAIKNLEQTLRTKDPEKPFSESFDPARMPGKVDIQLDGEGEATAAKTLYHLLGAGWWALKRDIANEKLRVHTNYFHHETEVTQFKRELDDED